MNMIKRFSLFILVNVLVIATISIFLNVLLPLLGFRIDPASTMGLLAFCTVWGFGGAFISLFISKWMAKMAMGVKIIDPNTTGSKERWMISTVQRLAKVAGLEKTPEVGIYDSPDLNAFATGRSRNSSLVAVSTGLLNTMSEGEVEGVLGHEIAHIANGDMVTMTLIQGVVNSFVMFFSRIVARIVASSVEEKNAYWVQLVVTIALDIAFGILGSMVVAYFSRIREYRADKGGAHFAGKEKMIAGLRRLQMSFDRLEPDNSALATMKISSKPGGLMAMFMSHPPLAERIRRLQLV